MARDHRSFASFVGAAVFVVALCAAAVPAWRVLAGTAEPTFEELIGLRCSAVAGTTPVSAANSSASTPTRQRVSSARP